MTKTISLKNVSTHNLKNISIDFPLNQLSCIYGPSGSGKSSLAFHTIAAESRRRFLNSLPTSMKLLWSRPQRAAVDEFAPVLPVMVLPQKNPIINSRTAIGDILGITELASRFFSLYSLNCCPTHKLPLIKAPADERALGFLEQKGVSPSDKVHLLVSPQDYSRLFGDQSFPVRGLSFSNNEIDSFHENDDLWEVQRFRTSGDMKFIRKLIGPHSKAELWFYTKSLGPHKFIDSSWPSCPKCSYSAKHLTGMYHQFDPQSAGGACQKCQGHGATLEIDRKKLIKNPSLGLKENAVNALNFGKLRGHHASLCEAASSSGLNISAPVASLDQEKLWDLIMKGGGKYPGLTKAISYLERKKYKPAHRIYLRGLKTEVICTRCEGSRVSNDSHNFMIPLENGVLRYQDFCLSRVDEAYKYCLKIEKAHNRQENNDHWRKSKRVLLSMMLSLESACELQLHDLKLCRPAKKINASEYQRGLLCKFLSYEGSSTLFILDEVSTALSELSQKAVIKRLKGLVKQGNTVIVVDHSEEIRIKSDFVVEMGPSAGENGGEIIYHGRPKEGNDQGDWPIVHGDALPDPILMKNARYDRYEFEEFKISTLGPVIIQSDNLRKKTSLLENCFLEKCSRQITGEGIVDDEGSCLDISLPSFLQKVIIINTEAGRSNARSTVGSFTGLQPLVRSLYAQTQMAQHLGLKEGHFSSNSDLGRCPKCEGRGVLLVEMGHLDDIEFLCDFCNGHKIDPYYSSITLGGQTFYETLTTPINRAFLAFNKSGKMQRILRLMEILGLGHLSLNRPIQSLSGGEGIRMKLLNQVQTRVSNSIIYIQNPSVGLSREDIPSLGLALCELTKDNNLVVISDESKWLRRMCAEVITVT